MAKGGKDGQIIIRIQKQRKDNWNKLCQKKNISLTNLIINSVENRILDNERREILLFIDKQDNIFSKIETNINQIAKIANSQKFIKKQDLDYFNSQLELIKGLKRQQNEIFIKIYSLLADDH